MTTAYTSLLGLALPVTGELSGTWGDTVNDFITRYVDAAVAGVQTISGSQTAVTLSTTNGASLTQAGTGASGSAQYAIINCTGNPASTLTITVPASSKTYVVINGTSTTQDVKIVGAGPTSGVTVFSGEGAIVAWNGSDFIKVASSLSVGDVVGPVSSTDNAIARFNGTGGDVIQNSSVTIADNGDLTFPAAIVETVFTITDAVGFEVNPSNGTIQLITLTANRSPKATNFSAGESVTLMVDDGSAFTLTWTDNTWGSGGVVWLTDLGSAPTLSTTGYTAIVLWKVGSQVYGARVGVA